MAGTSMNTLVFFGSVFCSGIPPATGTGTLIVHLEDYNDNAPFVVPSVAQVCEDASDMNVAVVGGRDKDLPPNAAPFKIELGKQAGLDKTWRVTRINCEYSIIHAGFSVPQGQNEGEEVSTHQEYNTTVWKVETRHLSILDKMTKKILNLILPQTTSLWICSL